MKKHACKYHLSFFVLILAFVTIPVNADLVGLWLFDEGSGTDALDSSGYDHHAELWAGSDGLVGGVSTPSTVPFWITRGSGYALEMGTRSQGVAPDTSNTNWNTAYVLNSYQPTLANLGLNWTIAFWYNQYTNDPTINATLGNGGLGHQRIISCPNYEFELGIPADSQDYFWPYYENGGTPFFHTALGATASLNSWHHVAIVYDGAELKKYVDGVLDSSATVSISNQTLPDSWASGEDLYFGRQTYPEKDYFIGALDEVAIFNEALDSTQVNTIMSGDFTGPWQAAPIPEDDDPVTFIYDSSFIVRYENGQVPLLFGEKSLGEGSFNWEMEGTLDNTDYYGLVNAGLWDGDDTNVEYAGYCTVGDKITQVSVWKPIHQDIEYQLSVRLGGEDAVGNVVGVKLYNVEASDPNIKTLITDLNQTIGTNDTWYDLTYTFTSTASQHLDSFKVECYIDQGSGNARGTAYGYFDYVRIDAVNLLTCQSVIDYNGSSGLAGDVLEDCHVDYYDYASIADDWLTGGLEPFINDGEMLSNPDLFEDIDRIPNNLDSDGGAPQDWEFVPATTDSAIAGVWNLDRNGMINLNFSGDYQPAGGSVTAYFNPDTDFEQTASSPIVNGTTYYATAMVSGSGDGDTGNPYGTTITAILEYVDDPVSPTTVTKVADANFIMPAILTWKQLSAEYTADAVAAGNYLRLRFTVDPVVVNGTNLRDPAGYGIVGKASITTVKPDIWPRTNLITNGDFEDVSSLPPGVYDEVDGFYYGDGFVYGYLNLYDYYTRYTIGPIPDWDTSGSSAYSYGLQCMFFAPAPQPALGRVAAWFDGSISQKITSQTIQAQTYYLDFIACLNAGTYAAGQLPWPANDPDMVVDLYWLAPGVNQPTGTQGQDYGLITSLTAVVTGPIDGGTYVDRGGWVSASTSIDGTAYTGNSFYVKAHCSDPSAVYSTFEEICLSTEQRPTIGAYTCYEQTNKFGIISDSDLNSDCVTDIDDLKIIALDWLQCSDPQGCN